MVSPGTAAGSPIGFRLEPGSGVPTYLQLVHQVEQALRLGHLTEGDRLPTVKETVGALAINPNTVLKAYRELEHRGLAEGKPGQGTFICGTLRRAGLAEQEALRRGLAGWLASADQAGLDADGMTALFTAAMRDFLDGRPESKPGPLPVPRIRLPAAGVRIASDRSRDPDPPEVGVTRPSSGGRLNVKWRR